MALTGSMMTIPSGLLLKEPFSVGLHARGVIAVHAGRGEIGHVDQGILAPFLGADADPARPVGCHGGGIAGPVVIDMLILAGEKTVVAVFTLCHINDEIPLFHRTLHFSIWTRQELAAKAWDFLIMGRLGVRMFMHPPRSGDWPGSPMGS